MIRRLFPFLILSSVLAQSTPGSFPEERLSRSRGEQPLQLLIEPPEIVIHGSQTTHNLVVTGIFPGGVQRDLTRVADYSLQDSRVAGLQEKGKLLSASPGESRLRVSVAGITAEVPVRVVDADRRALNFTTDIAPIFSRVGCNSSNCHGSLNGQGGFKLSLFGYDPGADWESIVKADQGRRINLEKPEQSLLLQKPAYLVPHGGGLRIAEDSIEYRALSSWITEGARPGSDDGLRLLDLTVYPQEPRYLSSRQEDQQLVVLGRYSDGRVVDMTEQVQYTASDETVVEVTPEGRVIPRRDGESNIMIRSLGAVGVARVAVVLRPPIQPYPSLEKWNYIDDLVFSKLERLHMVPSQPATDEEFIRRIFLDLIGTLPSAEEVTAFLEDQSPDKRSELIDSLFSRREFADFWSLKWGDLLTNSPQFLYNGTAYFQEWLRQAFQEKRRYDRVVRELLTSTGGTYQVRPSNFYAAGKKPEDLATFASQVFMGVSLECARCHDHPNEKWKRSDFLGMAAFFSQVRFKSGFRNNERYLFVDPQRDFKHPETKEPVAPRFLGGEEPELAAREDRRARLAEWLTAPDNPFFAKATVNRIWREFMGRGIVEPPDDFRETNPPSHPELLDRLAQDFVESGYDLRALMTTILNSRTYQLSSRTNSTNQEDSTAYSHRGLRRLTAEQLADAIDRVTGVPEKYPSFYPGKRAIQLPDPIIDSYFLTIFDRATRENATCSREHTASLAQSLNLISGEAINSRLSDPDGMLSRLLEEGRSDEQIARHFFLAALSRPPLQREIDLVGEAVRRSGDRRRGLEDFVWALLNSKEFLYNH